MSIASTINDHRTLHHAALPRPLQASLQTARQGSGPFAHPGDVFPETLRDTSANLAGHHRKAPSHPRKPAEGTTPHQAFSPDRLKFPAP